MSRSPNGCGLNYAEVSLKRTSCQLMDKLYLLLFELTPFLGGVDLEALKGIWVNHYALGSDFLKCSLCLMVKLELQLRQTVKEKQIKTSIKMM